VPAARPDRVTGFTPRELRALRGLGDPAGIQRALDAMPYHLAGTAWSPRRVLRERTAHCLEGAIFAAAALRVLGFPPLLGVQDPQSMLGGEGLGFGQVRGFAHDWRHPLSFANPRRIQLLTVPSGASIRRARAS